MNILELSDVLNDISDFVNGCLGPLGLDGLSNIATFAVDLGVQLCSTLIIFLLVRFLLWKPITKMLEQKREQADKELEEAHAANENAKAIEEELKKRMAEAHIEVKSILDSTEMEANARRDEIIKEAKAEAKRRVEAAQDDINQEIKNKQHEIQQMIVNTAFEAAEKILEHEVDKEKYLKVVNEIIEGASK